MHKNYSSKNFKPRQYPLFQLIHSHLNFIVVIYILASQFYSYCMKYCFLLLLMLPVLCFAQKHSAFSQNNIPNAANMIEIKGVARNEVTNALLDKGFQISDNDGPLNVIITEPKEAKKNSAILVTLYLYINDSS